MNELDLLCSSASYPDVYKECGIDLHKLECNYYTNGIPNNMMITFNPLMWIATNASLIFERSDCKKIVKHSYTPVCVVIDKKPIIKNNWITNECLINITRLALDYDLSMKSEFDTKLYYNTYYEKINHFIELYCNSHNNNDINVNTLIFYVCYGYWNDINLKPVDSLSFICSYPNLIRDVGVNSDIGAFHFYNNSNKIIFDPYVYVATNYNISDLVKGCVDSIGNIDKDRACKHYIRHGFHEKLAIDDFNHWEYLANNHNRIRKILKKTNDKKHIDYDIVYITKRIVAKDYIKRIKKVKHDVFSSTKFVKMYIDDDETVNKDKQLSIQNASKYFVRYYVLSEKVRYEVTMLNKIILFLQGRLVDSARQIPFNASRYIIENKCI